MQTEDSRKVNQGDIAVQTTPEKRPYQKPALKHYGTLATLTQGGALPGGTETDNAYPMSL